MMENGKKQNKKLRIIILIVVAAIILISVAAYFIISFVIGSITKDYYYSHVTDTNGYENEYSTYGEFYAIGYGFPYEYGMSSVDLEPYHPENVKNILPKPDGQPSFIIRNEEDMPVLDGAEAAYPVYAAFANSCYTGVRDIQLAYSSKLKRLYEYGGFNGEFDSGKKKLKAPVVFNNTVIAFEDMVKGDCDIFFGARPSESQKLLAQQNGRELVATPIGKEAFVFFVSSENPVDGLSSGQIRGIYSGEISNWREVGGDRIPVLPFQRPENSGSQTMMQYFMGDTKLMEPTKKSYVSGMGEVLDSVASFQNKASSIGYSFRFFATKMAGKEEERGIKLLSVDGVYPDEKSIADGSYPLTTELYAIYVKDNPNENVPKFVEWMTGEQGQSIVEQIGYVRVN